MAKIGIVTSVPLGMCTPLIMMSFLHSLLILNDVNDNQIVDKHINEICPKPGPEFPWTDLCGIYFVFNNLRGGCSLC